MFSIRAELEMNATNTIWICEKNLIVFLADKPKLKSSFQSFLELYISALPTTNIVLVFEDGDFKRSMVLPITIIQIV